MLGEHDFFMSYYTVWVSSNRYRSNEPLTYEYDEKLDSGAVVVVPFGAGNKEIMGLVDKTVTKPNIKTKKIIRKVVDQTLPAPTVNLFKWLASYYPASSSSHLQLYLPSNLLKADHSKYKKTTVTPLGKLKLPMLTNEQKNALKEINASKARTILLHGDTGSGKTRIYSELIYKTLGADKSALILTPEIGLTPQIINTLEKSFPSRVIVMHSGLTDKVRRENWLRILLEKDPLIVVGPRSALFTPLKNIGLIVVDEAHESSYKQEQAPYYQTTRVAAKLSELSNAKLVMGTATPLVSDYYILKSKDSLIVRMSGKATSASISDQDLVTNVVELTDRDKFSKSQWLSDDLISSISKSLSDKEQSLIFLNRRGTALVVLCQNCGWQALCPNCDTSLTYHADSHLMLCHSCSFHKEIPSSCPVCHSQNIVFKGAGTKAIADEVTRLFPAARISRFDRDNNKKDSLEANYEKLLKGEIDIAVGTQIITKGLDLPKLSTVGIVMADSNLSFPDYTAEEKTYQVLTQVIGRVARGHRAGRVYIQTYNPTNIALGSAINRNYLAFYEQQLKERQTFDFPPFVYLLKLSCSRSSAEKAKKACEDLARQIGDLKVPVVINGPSPSFHERKNGKFVWQLVIKSRDRKSLVSIVDNLPANYSYDLDPASLL